MCVHIKGNFVLKKYFDESFLLDYLAARTLTDFNSKKVDKENNEN